MSQNLLNQDKVELKENGIDSKVNCTKKFMDYNTNGEWRYVSNVENNTKVNIFQNILENRLKVV